MRTVTCATVKTAYIKINKNKYIAIELHLDSQDSVDSFAKRLKAVNKSFLIAINRMIINPPIVLEENFNGKDFLDFVHISSENTLPRRYIANVDFCFNSKLIREFLVKKKLQWSELISSEILMLPIWDDASGKRMWANNVLWLSSWRNFIKKTDSLIKFVILSPSISLERLLSPEAVSSRDKNVLKFAAKNAEAAQLILLFAYLDYYLERYLQGKNG